MRFSKNLVFYLVLFTVLFLFQSCLLPEPQQLILENGPGHVAEVRKRETKTLVLKNGLEVLLMTDPEVHRSAAALSVGVGDLFDPWEKMGLSHYLEHMLFLGTKKYPDVGSFEKYLAENSGAGNAYTDSVVTNYFFQVSHGAFEGALDRFSQFFKEPLFDEHYAEREVNAVDSEHEKNRLRDGWRASHAINQVSEEGHPIRKFGTGNKETLAGKNREALLDFYNKYYGASRMKLAVLSKFSLRVQEEIVKKYFGDIPDHPTEIPSIDPHYRKPLKDKYRFMKIKAIKDIHSLTLEFPTIRLHDHLDSKPADIVGSVLGYEGKGSLLSKLKKEGLVLGLSAGGNYSDPNISSFDISINLTIKGEREYERVLELVFSYIDLLRERGFEEYTFKELQTMAQIEFDWKDPEEGMGYVASRAAWMQNYQLKDVETLPYLYRKFEPEAYRAILETLTPENMLAVLQSQSVETDRTEPFYGTEYSITEVGGAPFEKLRHSPRVKEIYYPKRNDFIPNNLSLLEEVPGLVRDDDMVKVWFKFDNRFNQPKVLMKLLIETPRVYDTVENLAKSRLYIAAVREGLNEVVYPIQMAGLSYHLGIEKKGVTLSLGGYSERISDILHLVAKNLTKISIDEQKFNDLKRVIVRGLENRRLAQAYSRSGYYSRRLWLAKQYSEEKLIEALKSTTFDGVKAYPKRLYEKVFITGVAHGNWTEEKVRQSLEVLLDETRSKPLSVKERYEEVVEVLDSQEIVLFSKKVEDNNNALHYALQVGPMDFSTHAKASLVASIVETDFYTQLRTNQQLGYIVWSFNNRIEDRLFFRLVIQSATYDPFELKARVEAWMSHTNKIFDKLTDEEFERHRKGLIVSLEKKGDSIAEVTGNLYYYAIQEKGNFEFKRQLVKVVKGLKKEEVISAAREIFLESETPRIITLIRSQSNNKPIPEGVLTTVPQFKGRKAMR